MKLAVLGVLVLLGLAEAVHLVTAAEDEENDDAAYQSKLEDLSYSDLESALAEKQRHYIYREYGTPSDTVQLHLPRGLTVGDLFGSSDNTKQEETTAADANETTFDPWSIVWYIGSFGGLIAFFLVVSCSEWCCLRNRNGRAQHRQPQGAAGRAGAAARVRASARTASVETPPPAYHLFAPPPYDSIAYGEKTDKYDVFVVPVHTVHANFPHADPVTRPAHEVPPPEYTTVVMPPT